MLWFMFLPIAAADCPEHPPRIVGPAASVVRAPDGTIRTWGRTRKGERHGAWCTWDARGTLQRIETWQDGVQHGRFAVFGEERSVEGAYAGGQPDGAWVEHRYGVLYQRGAYEQGQKVGPWTEPHRRGTASGRYLAGQREGAWEISSGGVLRAKETYRAGVRHGRSETFDESGGRTQYETHADGVLEGPWGALSDGQWAHGQMHQGERAGTWRFLTEAGALAEEGTYRAGQRHGTWIHYLDGGRVLTDTWAAGVEDGPFSLANNGTVTSTGGYRNGQPHGAWVDLYPDGTRQQLVTYADGVLEGPRGSWGPDGRVVFSGTLQDGVRVGPWIEGDWSGAYVHGQREGTWVLRRDGAQLQEEQWSAGQRAGLAQVWAPDGTLLSACGYQGEQRDGRCQQWNAAGVLTGDWQYRGGALHGPYRTWHENGQLASQGEYREDEPEGLVREWNESGVLVREGSFQDGIPVGTWRWWHDNGRRSREGAYDDDGQEHGRWREWYASGARFSQGDYEHGDRTGAWRSFWPNGRPRSTGSYLNGEQHGPWRWSHDTGARQKEGTYLQGLKHGTWVFWFPSGARQMAAIYDNGAFVSTLDGGMLGVVGIGSDPDPYLHPEERPLPQPPLVPPACPPEEWFPFGLQTVSLP